MGVRALNREQGWLLPRNLEELLSQDHSARFVGAYVDALSQETWAEMGVRLGGEELGAPAYHPKLFVERLAVWLHDRPALLAQIRGGLP